MLIEGARFGDRGAEDEGLRGIWVWSSGLRASGLGCQRLGVILAGAETDLARFGSTNAVHLLKEQRGRRNTRRRPRGVPSAEDF